jgi:hypothetical protein
MIHAFLMMELYQCKLSKTNLKSLDLRKLADQKLLKEILLMIRLIDPFQSIQKSKKDSKILMSIFNNHQCLQEKQKNVKEISD